MNVIVIGLGSMGRRRIELIKRFDPSINVFGVDMSSERRQDAEKILDIRTYPSIKEAYLETNAESAFVSTSPLSHAQIINECLNYEMNVFTEINLVVQGYDENIELAKKKNKVLFLSSTFLYRKEIEYIKQVVTDSKLQLSYNYHVGQYLPDWHPWENYKDFFVGDKKTNGCRELMAIEFPWIIETFGKVVDYKVIKGKNSTLKIDYPDTYHILFMHENGHRGMIEIDVVSRKAERKLEVIGEELFLKWNGTPDSVEVFDIHNKESVKIDILKNIERKKGYAEFIVEDAYLNEIINFFNVISGKEKSRFSFEKDLEILKLIDEIEGE